MKLLFLLTILVAVISATRGIFFQTTSLGGQIQGDQQWQDFDQYGISNEERYTYQNPGYQQYVDYHVNPQSYQHPSEKLRPTQTLFHATQHLLQPAQQLLQPAQQLLQSGQQIYQNAQQNIHDPEHAFQLLPTYQLINGFQGSQLAPHNNVPLVVRLVENQSLLPIRAVYSLPPLLEKLVQRVQGYYSVYNAPEQLTLDRPLFTPTIAPPTTDLLATDITENSVISDSSPESSTAFPVHHLPSVSTSTVGQKIEPSTETPKQTTTGTSTTTTPTTGTSTTTTTSPSPQTTTTSTSNKSTEPVQTSTTSAPTTTSNKVSTLTVLEVTPTTTETEPVTDNSAHDTTTEEQTEQTTDSSNTPDTMKPDVEM